MKDFFVRGILPDFHYRYFLARSLDAVQEIWRRHEMSPGPAILTGEAAIGAFLLAIRGTKESSQTVGLHFECKGPAERIIAFGSFDGGIRGYASNPVAQWDGPLTEGTGPGMLTVSRFQDLSRKIYSSQVEFRSQPMARNLEVFIARSEQVQVFLELGPFPSEQNTGIFGLMFEAMPGADADRTDALLDWIARHELPARLAAGEPIDTLPDAEELLRGEIRHFCDCSQKKIEHLIRNLGIEEARSILSEEGVIEVTCEFCREKYRLTDEDVQRIFVEKTD